ncbi:MAG: hypothetical protein WD206_07185 [Actinomycetota bacterium]
MFLAVVLLLIGVALAALVVAWGFEVDVDLGEDPGDRDSGSDRRIA